MSEQFVVYCTECGEKHSAREVEFLGIEEDMMGRDVMQFVCPVTKNPTKSFVYMK